MKKNNHLYSLDLLRGFSGYGVAFCHLFAFVYKDVQLEYFSLLFVEFFFVLSGFVLYPQLIQVLENKKKSIHILSKKMDENFTSLFYCCFFNLSYF